MTDDVTARLQLIAVVGVALLALLAVGVLVPSCMGCGGLTFENPQQAHQFNDGVEAGMTQAMQSLVLGMSAIAVAGFLAQFAWKRYRQKKTPSVQ